MVRKIVIFLTSIFVLAWMAPHLSYAEPWFAWDAATGNVTGYRIYYGTSSGSNTHNKDVGNATEYPLVNLPLKEKTTYYFVVKAYNDNVESDGSNELIYTTPPAIDRTPPLTPKGVIAEVSGTNIILKWQANTESDLAGYKIYFGNSSRIYAPPIPAGNVTRYTIENLGPGKTYYLAVTALDSEENESGYSLEDVETIPFAPDTTTSTLKSFAEKMVAVTAKYVADHQSTVYENAEDKTINGWSIYDNEPTGAEINNIFDQDRLSYVIQFKGSGLLNGYSLRNDDGSNWQNSSQFVVEWSMKYSEKFNLFIDVKTTAGPRYLEYSPVNDDRLGKERYVHHGLGKDLIDGQWHTFTRNLQEDLEEAQTDKKVLEVNGFLIRGSGRVDDIKLKIR